jgi:hypothetical protein
VPLNPIYRIRLFPIASGAAALDVSGGKASPGFALGQELVAHFVVNERR